MNVSGYLPSTQAISLLNGIRKTGSINRSAKALGLSYSTAWRCLKETEDGISIRLLAPQKGGSGGGGTALTPEGSEFVEKYTSMLEEAGQLVIECYMRHFQETAL